MKGVKPSRVFVASAKPRSVTATKWKRAYSKPDDLEWLTTKTTYVDHDGPSWHIMEEGNRRALAGYLDGKLIVLTVDGNPVEVPEGSYIMADEEGFFYPCDAVVFEQRYEAI